ncbi:MAG: RNA methyltransferase, partial [Planctomycetota bacterium]|nr:RNA methyltransferase [Planctomycetota bacterium]
MITSLRNPRIKTLAALKTSKGRREHGLALAEGLHLAEEALQSRQRVKALLLAAAALARPEVMRLRDLARQRGAEIIEMTDVCYRRISDLQSPEGVAVAVAVAPAEIAPLIAASAARLLVAAGVQDPGNAGALVRTAEAAGVSACLFVGGVDLWSPKFLRAAMGSSFRLPCAAATTSSFLGLAQQYRLRLLAAVSPRAPAAQHLPPLDFERADYQPPVAICLGGEGAGLPPEIAAAATPIAIPMAGALESLNVA